MNIVEDVGSEQLLSTYRADNNTSIFKKYDDTSTGTSESYTVLKNFRSMAKSVDNFNLKYFSKLPLAVHPHSAFAIKKMAGMVIGKINEIPLESQSKNSPLLGPKETKNTSNIHKSSRYLSGIDENMIQEFTQRIKFRIYKLTSKSPVSSNTKYPVIRFTFTKVHQGEKNEWDEKFLPGHYIELQSRIKGQVVIRSYTPIEGKMSKSFSIYVKVYPNGLMSRHLVKNIITSLILFVCY